MQGSRYFPIRRKARIIIDKSFPVFNDLEMGDKGQVLIDGVIEGERLEEQDDGTELYLKMIKFFDAQLTGVKPKRQ